MGADRILVIDDDSLVLKLVETSLQRGGYDVLLASDGEEGLETTRCEHPDLIISDIMMPKLSGFEVCKKLKDDPATSNIMILMVTALNELGDIERGVESGTDDFLSKPVNRLELLTRVKSLLKLRHLKDELERTLAYLNDVESAPPAE